MITKKEILEAERRGKSTSYTTACILEVLIDIRDILDKQTPCKGCYKIKENGLQNVVYCDKHA